MWVNVKRAETARGAFVGGQQMYVEYMIPAQVRHPFPVVLVHGGGGQGTDWMGTPDGRPGWFQYLVQEGFKVYVVDRPGHGRSPLHPDLHGGFAGAGGGAREHRRPIHAAERESRADAERVSEEPHAVAGAGQRRIARSRSARRRAGRQLRAAGRGRRAADVRVAAPGGRRCARRRGAAAGTRRAGGTPVAPRTPCSQRAGAQRAARGVAAGRRGPARQDRSGDHHDALGRRSLRAARRRGAAESREGDGDHRRRRLGIRRRQPLGHVEHSGHLRSAGQRSGGDQDAVGRESRSLASTATSCRPSRRAGCRT